MRRRALGKTGLEVSELSLGTWGLSGEAYDGGLVGMPHYTLPKIVKYEKDAMTELARLLLARALTPPQLLPTSPLGLAAAIFSLHRNTPEFRIQWSECAQKLKQYFHGSGKFLTISEISPGTKKGTF